MAGINDLFDHFIYESEYHHLKESCYLDQTGAALYMKSQVEAMAKDLQDHLYANPHSNSLPSRLCADSVDQVRYRILQHFNTTTDDYSLIFTSGATEALKIVAETFTFTGKLSSTQQNGCPSGDSTNIGEFVYLQDNHTSVLGMRNVDNITFHNVPVRCVSQAEAIRIFESESKLYETSDKIPSQGNSLFVYPAQCNFSGMKYPLSWIGKAQQGVLARNSRSLCRWFCLLDAATHVSTNPLDLSAVSPDFVCLSFYKMFGLPTGLGALLVRNSSAPVLHKRYYGGGTVQVALSTQPTHVLRTTLHERFEDGTINYLSIIALRHGLDLWRTIGLDMNALSEHCFRLAQYTHCQLRRLHHSNDRAAVRLYADTPYDDSDRQGGIVNFNMIRHDGQYVGFMEVLNLANLHGIHLRTGCFCNPGACQRHLEMTDQQYYANFEAGHVCGDDKDLIGGRPTGSVRVSFGPHSRQRDADRLLALLTECFVNKPAIIRDPDNWELISEQFTAKFAVFNQLTITNAQDNVKRPQPIHNGTNNVINQFQLEGVDSQQTESSGRLSVSRVCLYPVKSCGALEVDSWPLDHRGLRYDRGWMVVSDLGTALTQKHEPQMCLIKPLVDEERGLLTLTFKGFPACSVALHSPDGESTALSSASVCQSKVCGSQVQGWDCGEAAAQWLSTVLRRSGLRLLRQTDHRTSRGRTENGPTTLALTNEAQFLLVNENSVDWLCDKLPDHSDCSKTTLVDRFRSNFVVKGDWPAFEEQNWKEVKIGSISFHVDGPCGRCQMICIDQFSGKKTKEPLTTLAANCQGRMKFGIYLRQTCCSNNGATVKVGDPVIPTVKVVDPNMG